MGGGIDSAAAGGLILDINDIMTLRHPSKASSPSKRLLNRPVNKKERSKEVVSRERSLRLENCYSNICEREGDCRGRNRTRPERVA